MHKFEELTKYLASNALVSKMLLNFESVIPVDNDNDDDDNNDDSRPQAAVDNFLLFHSVLHPNGEIFPRCRKLQLISCDAKPNQLCSKLSVT